MSKAYKSQEIELSIINCLLLIIVVTTMIPVIIMSVVIGIIGYLLNINYKYLVYTGLIIVVNILIFFKGTVINFLKNNLVSLYILCIKLTKGELYINMSFDSIIECILMFGIAMILTGFLLNIVQRNKKYKNAGIKTLDEEVKEMPKENQKSKLAENTGTYIGKNQHNKKVYISDNFKHALIAGTTGSGKTVLISNFIKSALEKNYGMLLVDGKGDVEENSMLDITKKLCEKYHRKLYVINMNDPAESNKYNPFINCNETVAKDMLINMTEWSEQHYKINTERYLQNLMKILNIAKIDLCFENIVNYMIGDKLEQLINDLQKEKIITKEDKLKYFDIVDESKKIAKDASARFATIQESVIGTIFDETGIDITTAIQDKAVILFVLNPLLYPETSGALGRLVLIDAKKAVSNLFHDKSRKFFIFDEMNVYISSVLLDLINKSRSACVSCICATQSLSDLEITTQDDTLKNQVIENCNNYIVLRQNSSKSAEEWAQVFGTRETMQMTYQMQNMDTTEMGTAKKVRIFHLHPDTIKSFGMGQGAYLSKDNSEFEIIKVNKPF